MDLRDDILESFSRIHKRPLLLENGDPEAIAAAELQKAQSSPQPPTTSAPYVTQGARAQVAIFQTPKGWKFAPMGSDGRPNTGKSKFIDQEYQTFVGYFAQDGTEQQGQPGEDQQQQAMATEALGPGGMVQSADLSDDTKHITSTNLMHVAGRVQAIWDELPEAMQSKFGNIRTFANFFTGARPESFERKLINAKVSLHLENGVWNTIPEPPQEAQTSLISDSFRDLVDAVADGTCNPDILDDFAVAGKDVVISPKGHKDDRTDALAFNDTTGFLRMLLTKAAKNCGKQVNKATLRTATPKAHGGDNAIRGFAFEDILEAASLLRLKAGSKGEELSRGLTELINSKLINVHDKLSKLTLDNEVWIKAYEESALDPNQAAMIRDISQILKGGVKTNNLYASMLKHSNHSLKIRGAIYALPVGDQTGQGQRQDVLEIYASQEEAMAAAKRSGIKAVPSEDLVENAFVGDSEATLSALKSAGVFQDGQVVYGLKVSLKNYMKLDHAVFGGGRFSSFKDLINTPLEESKFMETIMSNLNMDEADYSGFQEYAGEMDTVGESVYSVPLEAKLLTKAGTLNQRTSKTMAEELLQNLNKNHRFPELNRGELRKLKTLAETVAKDSGTKHEVSAAYTKLQHRLNAFLQAKKIQKDINAGGDKARRAKMFAAVKMFHAGGSDDDNLMCDYRELTTGLNYIFKQNDPLRDAWNSVLNEDGAWSLKVTDAGQITLNRGKQSIFTKNEVVPTKNAKGKAVRYNVNSLTQVNRAVMQEYDKYGGVVNESKELGHLLSKIELLFEKARSLTLK